METVTTMELRNVQQNLFSTLIRRDVITKIMSNVLGRPIHDRHSYYHAEIEFGGVLLPGEKGKCRPSKDGSHYKTTAVMINVSAALVPCHCAHHCIMPIPTISEFFLPNKAESSSYLNATKPAKSQQKRS